MRVLLVVTLLAAPLLAAPSQGVARPRRREVPVNPEHSPAEWEDIFAVQTLGREVCAECKSGTTPQHPLAGKMAEKASLRIIGGNTVSASTDEFPWMASITMDDAWSCGGSLISDKFILTAGQCVSGYLNFMILLGDVSDMYQSSTMHIAYTNKAVVHDDYAEDTITSDIGLLQLLLPVTFTDAIRPIKLPSAADVSKTFEGETPTIMGWGETEYGFVSYNLKYVAQTVMSNKRCARFLGSSVTAAVICGDGEGKVGACGTDAGGPLVLKGDEADAVWTQIGIYSFGSELGCTWGYPSAYTRVTEYLQWIEDKTQIKS